MLHDPSPEQVACQHPKPILLDCGEITEPYAWQPSILPAQLVRVGDLVIIAVPAEFTTMSGRRMRDAVRKVLTDGKVISENAVVVIAGLSNAYSDYVATEEEYQEQRYEGASTSYGPHTLRAWIQIFEGLARDMVSGKPTPAGPAPPNLASKQLSFIPPVIDDGTPFGKHFGDVDKDANAAYKRGDVVEVSFWTGCPRNNLRTDDPFLTVERQTADGKWDVVFTDSDPVTEFRWNRPHTLSTESIATIVWYTDADVQPGTYIIRHYGTHKNLLGHKTDFGGKSRTFTVA